MYGGASSVVHTHRICPTELLPCPAVSGTPPRDYVPATVCSDPPRAEYARAATACVGLMGLSTDLIIAQLENRVFFLPTLRVINEFVGGEWKIILRLRGSVGEKNDFSRTLERWSSSTAIKRVFYSLIQLSGRSDPVYNSIHCSTSSLPFRSCFV